MSGLMSAGEGMPVMLEVGWPLCWDMGLPDVSMLIGFSMESVTQKYHTMKGNEWCFRPRFCTVRLYWAGDNLGECNEFCYGPCQQSSVLPLHHGCAYITQWMNVHKWINGVLGWKWKWNDWCFRPRCCFRLEFSLHCKTILGWGQPGLMRWIFGRLYWS